MSRDFPEGEPVVKFVSLRAEQLLIISNSATKIETRHDAE